VRKTTTTEQDELLKQVVERARAGQQVQIHWSELQPYFSDGTDKQQWQRMVNWANLNNLAFRADNIERATATKPIKATIVFWSSLPKIDRNR
jgi:hypothetical protein